MASQTGAESGSPHQTRIAREQPAEDTVRWPPFERAVGGAVAVAAVVFLTWRSRAYFPNAHGFVGHDYAWFLPTLLLGHHWHLQNGWLTPPYFTPALCGGMPLLGNPQSVFYSLPQLLMLALEPVSALFATLLVSAAVGATGCYVLLRRHFAASGSAAVLGATLFLVNGFLFYRIVVGHLTYHAVAVIPLLACVVASVQGARDSPLTPSARRLLVPTIVGGLLIAYVSYGGALNLQIPVVLGVACTLLLLQIERGFRFAPWIVLATSCVWGLSLSAMKVLPAVVLSSQFPRPYIPLYLFQNPVDLVLVLGAALFVPAVLPDGVPLGTGMALPRHELQFGVSLVPPLVFLLAVRGGLLRRVRFVRRILWLALAGLLLIPLVLTFGSRAWGEFLLRVPLINNNTTFVRWWAIYLLPLLVVASRCLDVAAATTAGRSLLLVCCLAVALVQEATHNPVYFVRQGTPPAGYDPRPVTTAYRQIRGGLPLPPIERIVWDPNVSFVQSPSRPNDAFLGGASAWPCYEPIFGYYLDLLPDLKLVTGPITLVSADQRLNLVDPSQYFARPQRAAPSWRFDVSRRSEAVRFAEHRPYEWHQPWWHKAAVGTTMAALLATVTCLAVEGGRVFGSVLRRRRRLR